jgi:protocatechuate 3,4-dioxygenase beta subunit
MRARLLLAATILSLAVPTLASITGTVIDHDGKPIAGARVSAFALETRDARRTRLLSKTPERTALVSATTTANGTFTLNPPKDVAVVELQADAKGYGFDVIRTERDEESVTMMLPVAAMKSGTITANGKPVAGVTVAWIGNGAEAIATTDAQGKYSVVDPSKWANVSLVFHPDYALNEQFYYGQRKADPSLTLDPGVAITGRVVGADGNTPVAGATLMVGTFSNAKTNDDGTFTIAHAPKKWDMIEARSGDLIGERANSAKAPTTMKLAPGATISGVVRDVKSQQPLAGAEVRLSRAMGGRGGMRIDPNANSAITDAKGVYTFGGVRPGSYDVSGSRPGYAVMPAMLTVTSAQKAQKPLAANPQARISGTVVDEEKRGVAAAQVAIDAPSRGMGGFPGMNIGGRNTVTGPDGRFVLSTAREGDVIIEATKKGYPSAKTNTFRLASGERKGGITLTIPRGIAVTGRVTDNNGKPLSGVSVVAISADSGGSGGGPGVQIRRTILAAIRGGNNEDDLVQTGTDGSFMIRLKEGMYDVSFKREGFAPASVRSQRVNATTKPMEVKLGPGVEIAGIVRRSGNPVADVMVIAMGGDSQSFASTGPDGRFTVPDLQAGSYMVMLNKQDDFIQQMKTVSAPATDVTIDLPPGGRVTGHVVDKTTHQPITSFEAGVSTSRSGGGMVINTPPMMRNFTSDDGSFTLENVPTGTMQIMANAPGYTTGRVPSVVVEEGKTTENIEVGLDAGVKLSGRVTGPDGAALAGVFIRPDSGGPMRGMNFGGDSTTTTDANGEYSIDSLEPGEKTFSFTHSGYLPESRTTQLNSQETRLDVQLSSGIRINGVVVTDAGAPVADANVRATSAANGGFGRSTRTDANGAFLFEGVSPGHYSFNASKEGFADALAQDVDISDGSTPVRLSLKTGGIVTGHIIGVAPSEYGNVSVQIRSSTGGGTQVAVDQGGNFHAEGAPTGTLRVSADVMNGFTDRRTTEVKTVELAPGGSVQVDLEFNAQTVVRGHVTRNGGPLQSAMVSFTPHMGSTMSTTGRTTTDDGGNYTISGLSDGTYDVTVIEQRLNPYTTTFNVSGSSNFDIDIKSVSLRGRVTDSASGDPISDAAVNLRAKNNDNVSFFAQRTATTDANGVFVLDSVSAGTYTATAAKEGYGSGNSDVYVGDSAPADLELHLAKNDGVTIKVVDARDGRVLAAQIVVYDGGGAVAYDGGPMMFGSAEPVRAPLTPGQYRAVVAAPGYAAQSVPITSPGQPTIGLTPGGTLQIHASTAGLMRGRLVSPNGVYTRPFNRDGVFGISGATTQVSNVQPGSYTLEVLGTNGSVVKSVPVTIVEGQLASVGI